MGMKKYEDRERRFCANFSAKKFHSSIVAHSTLNGLWKKKLVASILNEA